MNFIQESASEASSDDEEVQPKRSQNQRPKEIDSSEEDEDEEEEEPMDDLINDEEEEEEDSSDDDEKSGGKRSHDDDDGSSSVDSDDYELMREAGVSMPRKKKKQFKRIRTVAESDDEAEPDDGRSAIARDLFPASRLLDSDNEDETPQDRDLKLTVDSEEDESDPDENFIVDDDDQPIKKDRRKKVHADSAYAEAIDTFGVDFDFKDVEAESEDDYDEEGDYDEEDETGAAKPRRRRAGAKTIHEVYEPADLERFHYTPFDQQVRTEDKPERHQLIAAGVTEADDAELEQEASWIFRNAFNQPTISIQEEANAPIAGRKSELIIPEIKYALNCIRNEKLEVPFISAYRREYVLSIATNFDDNEVLWTIFKQNQLWCKFKKSKEARLKTLKEMQTLLKEKPDDAASREITEYHIGCVENVTTFEEIEDCRICYQSFSPEKKNRQRNYQEGLAVIIKGFGLTPEQFGENLREDYQSHNVVQCQRKPLDVATDAAEKTLRSKEDCLDAATKLYAKMLSSDPTVRQIIRRYYFENAVINVKPTPQGITEIDESHPCFSIASLMNMPVKELCGQQIIDLTNAERDKLLKIEFSIEEISREGPHISTYQEALKVLYYSDFSSIVTKEWNDQREKAVKICTNKYLFPVFEKELRERLLRESREKIIKTCCEKLRNWLNVAPYAPALAFDNYEDFELRNGTRICGFTFAPEGDAPCFAAIIDSEGELIDHVRLPYLNMRKRPDRMSAIEKDNHFKDRQKFKQFVINRKPHAVALAAETIQTKYICQDLAQILDELREHDGLPLIPIEIVDNNVSSIYMNSKEATKEFPEFKSSLLQAISNARRLNDPLSEFAKLCNMDNDILCLRFHSLQDDLPREDFLDSLYQEFVTRVNAVGVDPNRAIAHPHTATVLQFLAGLGPRKAAHLIRSIKKSSTGGRLVSRQQLVRELGMTPAIFMNCAGFIKLDIDTLADEFPDEHITPLDSTRIHPESYGLAKKIACDAFDYDEDASGETTANAIEEILDDPEKLDDLDLNAFAGELERQNQGKKGFTLQSIREEFQIRYRDHREAYVNPIQEEIFAMLTKETPSTFYVGKLITCQVTQFVRIWPTKEQLESASPCKISGTDFWQCPFCRRADFTDLGVVWNHFDTNDCPGKMIGVRCKLDNGLSGFIPVELLSTSRYVDISSRVQLRQTIHARVKKIDTEKFSCVLTCLSADLNDESGEWRPAKHRYFDQTTIDKMKEELRAKVRTRKSYCKRVIVHPAFENIDFKTCEKKLQLMDQGHAIIRPSSEGQNFLTVSWKVCDGVTQHTKIREEGKVNSFSLGHKLYIGDEEYEDLDEIIARYVQPMASYARELLSYKYCIQLKDGFEEKQLMRDTLLNEKGKSSSIPYRFIPSREIPGKFLIGYLPKDKPKIEYVSINPKGYRFRMKYFIKLVQLIAWFKENWNKLPPPVYSGITPGIGDSVRQTFPMSQ